MCKKKMSKYICTTLKKVNLFGCDFRIRRRYKAINNETGLKKGKLIKITTTVLPFTLHSLYL